MMAMAPPHIVTIRGDASLVWGSVWDHWCFASSCGRLFNKVNAKMTAPDESSDEKGARRPLGITLLQVVELSPVPAASPG